MKMNIPIMRKIVWMNPNNKSIIPRAIVIIVVVLYCFIFLENSFLNILKFVIVKTMLKMSP